MSKQTVAFTLDTEKDRDLLHWLSSLPKGDKSRAVRDALRAHLGRGGITLGDIYEAIIDLKRHGLVVQGEPTPTADEPPDVAAALDNLGL